ncbi:P-loop NTPase fold protein [Methanocella arvoryzae]|nr:P-loop NTPase fold protein [Methanocella arvoryzae]
MTKMTKAKTMRFVNPFNAQGPTNPKYYANREKLLLTFHRSVMAVSRSGGVTRPVNIAVMGGWGVGKTSTLLKFKDMIKNESEGARIFSACVPLSPNCCSDADTFFVYLMESIFREYESTVELPQRVVDFIREELNVFENWKISKVSMTPEIERREHSPPRGINFKETMIKFWEKLHAGGIQLAVVMLDDIHYALASRENAELLYDLRTVMQGLSASGAQFMFIITGPANLYPEMRDKAEPFTRLFERFDLEPFDIEGTRQLIEKPLEAEGIDLTIDDPVVEKIHQITDGHPYFLTVTMRDVLDEMNEGRLTIMEFKGICPALIEHFARLKFHDDLDRASDAEQELLFRMALAQQSEITPSELKGSSVTKLLDRLVKKELVVKVARGRYRLYNPLFREYLKNVRPLAE